MKKLLLLLILVVLLNTSFAVQSLKVTSSTANMESGKTGIISLSLQNDGTGYLYDVEVALVSLTLPLTSNKLCQECSTYTGGICNKYADSCFFRIDDLAVSESTESSFEIPLSTDIQADTYLATFVVKYLTNKNTASEQSYTINKVVTLDITSGAAPRVSIDDIQLPKKVYIGDEFWLNFSVSNHKNEDLKDVIVRLEGSDLGNVLSIVGSTNEILTTSLKSGESANINTLLRTSPSISVGIHNLEIKLNYTTYQNEEYSSSFNVSFIVSGRDNFLIYVQEITPQAILKDEIAKLSIGIANIGTTRVESVGVKILPSDNILVNTITQNYVGNLDVGDYTTVNFNLIPTKDGELPVNFELVYTDSLGETKTTNATVVLDVGETQFSILRISSQEQGSTFDYLGLLVMAGVIIFIFYYWKKSKRKRE